MFKTTALCASKPFLSNMIPCSIHIKAYNWEYIIAFLTDLYITERNVSQFGVDVGPKSIFPKK